MPHDRTVAINLEGWRKTVVPRAALPRKEVIQPHLPVRLPCYDLTPIAEAALDADV